MVQSIETELIQMGVWRDRSNYYAEVDQCNMMLLFWLGVKAAVI